MAEVSTKGITEAIAAYAEALERTRKSHANLLAAREGVEAANAIRREAVLLHAGAVANEVEKSRAMLEAMGRKRRVRKPKAVVTA